MRIRDSIVQVDRKGTTRIVFVFKHFVIKFPSFSSWKLFLHGLLANIQEGSFTKAMEKQTGLVPVYYFNSLGFCLISKRARLVKHRGLFWVELTRLVVTSELHEDFWLDDVKPENFGFINNQLVKIDLG